MNDRLSAAGVRQDVASEGDASFWRRDEQCAQISSRLVAKSSRLVARASRFRAQSSRILAQSSELVAQVPRIVAQARRLVAPVSKRVARSLRMVGRDCHAVRRTAQSAKWLRRRMDRDSAAEWRHRKAALSACNGVERTREADAFRCGLIASPRKANDYPCKAEVYGCEAVL